LPAPVSVVPMPLAAVPGPVPRLSAWPPAAGQLGEQPGTATAEPVTPGDTGDAPDEAGVETADASDGPGGHADPVGEVRETAALRAETVNRGRGCPDLSGRASDCYFTASAAAP